MSFQKYSLSEEIQRALVALKYETPTAVQQEVIPVALQGSDCIVQAQTGSGKTAAFAIPLVEKSEWLENKPQVLVLTPTRELAVQVAEEFTAVGRYKRIKAVTLYGKQPFRFQQTELKQKTHVVVGTPGRVLDHLEKGTLKLSKLTTVVLDEADEMLNMGFIDQVESILKFVETKVQTLLFSATMPERVMELADAYTVDAKHIRIAPEEVATSTIEHFKMTLTEEEKMDVLKKLSIVENPDSAIIFCRTKDRVDEVHDILYDLEYSVDKLHGGMDQKERLLVMNDFKRGDFRYLVATDVAARGIDIENVTHVFNYDLPMEKEAYIHRTGRTGRAGLSGKAITFKTPYEDQFMAAVEDYIGYELKTFAVPSDALVEARLDSFNKKMERAPKRKKMKLDAVNEGITRLYFNGGKKKKLRAVDFVGTICKIPGISASDIGIITIIDTSTFIEILNGKAPIVLKAMRTTPVKGKLLKVHIAK